MAYDSVIFPAPRGASAIRATLHTVLLTMVVVSGVAVRPATAAAEEARVPALIVTAACPPRASVGRVVCRVDVSWPAGARVPWLDLIVQSTPDGIRPLRSRIAGKDATAPEPTRRVFELALVVPATADKDPRVAVQAGAAVRGPSAPKPLRVEPAGRDVEAEIQFQVRAVACQGTACAVVTSNAMSRVTLTRNEVARSDSEDASHRSSSSAAKEATATPKTASSAAADGRGK